MGDKTDKYPEHMKKTLEFLQNYGAGTPLPKPRFHRPERFRVFIFFPDGTSHPEGVFDGAQAAVARARDFMSRPAMKLGMIPRVIVTDGGDDIVFEFKHGEGITFPLTDVTRKWNETYLKQHKEASK